MSKPIVGWLEVTGKDGPALQEFYSRLFGWEVTDAGSGYGLVGTGEKGIGGGIGASADGGDGGVTLDLVAHLLVDRVIILPAEPVIPYPCRMRNGAVDLRPFCTRIRHLLSHG